MNIEVNSEIVLKTINISDSSIIYNAILKDKKYLAKYLSFIGYINNQQDVIDYLHNNIDYEYVFCIYWQNTFVGMIGFSNTDVKNHKTSMFYWILEEYQKKGIARKSADILLDFAFFDININRVEIKCATKNISSMKLAEYLNFVFEGIEYDGECFNNDSFLDLLVYSKLKVHHQQKYAY